MSAGPKSAPAVRRRLELLGTLDRGSLLGMAASVALMLQPWWVGGLRAGFFLTAAFTLLQIVVSHLGAKDDL